MTDGLTPRVNPMLQCVVGQVVERTDTGRRVRIAELHEIRSSESGLRFVYRTRDVLDGSTAFLDHTQICPARQES